jgi:hypothetical protein
VVKRVALAALVLAVGACNLIVGIGEHHLRDDVSTDGGSTGDAVQNDASSDGGADVTDAATDSPIVLASGQQNPSWLLFDTNSIYWVNEADGNTPGAIMRIDKVGGTASVVAPARARPVSMRYDAQLPYLYFTDDYVAPDGGTYGLYRVPRGGGAIVTLDADGTGYGYAALGIGASLCSAAVAPNGQGARVRCSSRAGPPQTPCYPYATSAAGATFPTIDGDSQYVYVLDTAAGAIMRADIGDCTGASAIVFASAPGARHIAFNGTNVMWVTATEVWRLERANPGGTPFLIASGFNSLFTVAPTPNNGAVISDKGAGTIIRIRYPSITTVATGQIDAHYVIADTNDVLYWTNRSSGEVMKLSP